MKCSWDSGLQGRIRNIIFSGGHPGVPCARNPWRSQIKFLSMCGSCFVVVPPVISSLCVWCARRTCSAVHAAMFGCPAAGRGNRRNNIEILFPLAAGGGIRAESEAEAMWRYARGTAGEGAVPRSAVVLEEASTSTRTNAVNSLALAAGRRWALYISPRIYIKY